MNRFKLTSDGVAQTVAFLKDKTKPAPVWAKRFRDDLVAKGTKVFYKGLEVIPVDKVDDYLRDRMFKKDGTLPFGRDAAHHKLKTTVVGVTRRALMRFIKAQDAFEHTKAAVPKAKRKGGPRLKTYQVQTDLVFIRKNDLVDMNRRFEKSIDKEETYMVSSVEVSTGLSRLDWTRTKDPKIVTPIVLKHIRSISAALQVHPRTIACRMDAGTEFNHVEIKKVVPDTKIVKVAASVEKKNQDAQRVFYRILKTRRSVAIPDALKQTQKLLNETFNRIHGASPNELVEKSTKFFNIRGYNSERKEYIAGDRRKPFVVGQRVRIVTKPAKGADIGYKSYKGATFSERIYIIKKIQKSTPRKYWVASRWLTQDKLKSTEAEDKKTTALIKKRDEDQKEADEKEEEKAEVVARKEAVEREKVKQQQVAAGTRRSTRRRNPEKERLRKEREKRQEQELAQFFLQEEKDAEERAKKKGGDDEYKHKRVGMATGGVYERAAREDDWKPKKRKRKRRTKRVKRV